MDVAGISVEMTIMQVTDSCLDMKELRSVNHIKTP